MPSPMALRIEAAVRPAATPRTYMTPPAAAALYADTAGKAGPPTDSDLRAAFRAAAVHVSGVDYPTIRALLAGRAARQFHGL